MLRTAAFKQPSPPPAEVAHLFSAVVIMALLTTVAAPVALKRILGDAR